MKNVKIKRPRRQYLKVLLPFAAFAMILAGIAFGYGKLHELYLEQSEITDFDAQVEIDAGKMVRPAMLAEMLGLKKGANLATLDFEARRAETLRRIPTLRDIAITRKAPGRIAIRAEERVPIARMGIKGHTGETGRTVDDEGMVFFCQRGTQLLPVIREARAPGTAAGQKVANRTLAALRVVEAIHEPQLTDLGLLEIDVSPIDFLLLTLGDYSKVKLRWDGMDAETTALSSADLRTRLGNLLKAIRSRLTSEVKVWNATMPDIIYADRQER